MLPELITPVPGPKSAALADRLRQFECRNVTYLADDWPIFWKSAKGSNVWDVDGNRYLDLTSAFGVAGLGHRPEPVVNAMLEQSQELLHAMGDVHPTELKVRLCEKLVAMTFERWGLGHAKVTLSNSGFEAVETALKTAFLATGKPGVISFDGGYHGLGYGALLAGSFPKFREPFEAQLSPISHSLTFPRNERELSELETQLGELDPSTIGALLIEPIQGRGGKVLPAERLHSFLREWCDENAVILIHDEIYSGFQRTGKLFAGDHWGVRPDLICVGKAMSSGFPISACIGKSAVMDAWPLSTGEAIHTSTFLGHPVGCAMALASLEALDHHAVSLAVEESGHAWVEALQGIDSHLIHEVRGKGLMIGVELRHTDSRPAGDVAGQLLGELLAKGIIALADGPDGNVLAITPPFEFAKADRAHVVKTIGALLCRHH